MPLSKYLEHRPWGNFEQFCLNEKCTVKILTVKPGQQLSLQYHHHREEFWRILSGSGTIIIGEETFTGNEGDEFLVPVKTKHRLKAGTEEIRVLEIAFGEFDENDTVRLEDDYKRV